MILICCVMLVVIFGTCWNDAERRAQKYKHQRDMLYRNLGVGLYELVQKDLEQVLDQIEEEQKR